MSSGLSAASSTAAAASISRGSGAGPSNVVHGLAEELPGKVVGLSCDVLGQPDICRTALSWIEHDRQRLRQSLDYLTRSRDAVPKTGDCPKRVTHSHRRAAEMLDLLENGVHNAMLKGIATDQQER